MVCDQLTEKQSEIRANNNTPHRMVGLLGYKIEYGGKAGASHFN
jgi:hypothetical protein